MTPISLKEASRILRRQPGARLVLTACKYWVVPGGRVSPSVAWRLIQKLIADDVGLLSNCPQTWRWPGDRREPGGDDRRSWEKTMKEIREMDIREFLGVRYIKHGDHKDGPRRAFVVDVQPGKKFDKPDMTVEYDDGVLGLLSLNTTNLTALTARWGWETDRWQRLEIELSDGKAPFGNGFVDSVIAKPISPAIPREQRTSAPSEPSSSSSKPIDDEIPFMPERR